MNNLTEDDLYEALKSIRPFPIITESNSRYNRRVLYDAMLSKYIVMDHGKVYDVHSNPAVIVGSYNAIRPRD